MSEFVLRPAHLREGKFVPDRVDEQVVLDWAALVERFSPARTRAGAMILRAIRPGMFIGTRRQKQGVTTFYFDAAGRSRNAAHVLKQDPLFEESVVEVFYVDSVDWGMKLQELGAA
jgi:hypothetical protein